MTHRDASRDGERERAAEHRPPQGSNTGLESGFRGSGHGGAGGMTSRLSLGQRGAITTAWAQLRDLTGQLRRASGRRAWLADLRALPGALRWALPWAVLGRTSRDANPWRWLERQARRRRAVVAVSDPTRSLTFEQLRVEGLEVAAALERLGVVPNARVALLLPTGVDLVAALLGCWKAGAIPCPLDPGAPASVLAEIRAQLEAPLEVLDYAQIQADAGGASGVHPRVPGKGAPTSAQASALQQSEQGSGKQGTNRATQKLAPAVPHPPIHAADLAMILPTSGSEGHIKLCRVTAGRLALSGHAFGGVALGCRRGDVIYCPLPLCHATGITVGLMPALVHGVTLHLPGKFSASKLLQGLRDTNATQLVYVGDLLRMAVGATTTGFGEPTPVAATSVDATTAGDVATSVDATTTGDVVVANTTGAADAIACACHAEHEGPNDATPETWRPESTLDDARTSVGHRVRVAVGNGLDQCTFVNVQNCLRIPRIVEFYGATEAPRVLLNLSNRAGSCGRVALRRMSRYWVVKELVSRESETAPDTHAKVATWDCCQPGEVGELWIRIPPRQRPWLGDFEGYLDREHESHVVLRDVFRRGDRFYRTHDLVRYDKDDYFYFVERLGDVWRNRGHNVSTTWLAGELRQVDGVKDACVCPVSLDDSPRRFGLAQLVMADRESVRDALTQKISSLPSYARPQLVQVVPSIPRTPSFKPVKGKRGGAWEPSGIETALYLWDQGLHAVELVNWAATRARLLAR